jgi:hypothetical protein
MEFTFLCLSLCHHQHHYDDVIIKYYQLIFTSVITVFASNIPEETEFILLIFKAKDEGLEKVNDLLQLHNS